MEEYSLKECLHFVIYPPSDEYLSLLTPRELEITKLLIDGLTNREIAERLVIAEGTVKKTVSNIYKKLEVGSRVQLLHRVLHYK